MALVLVETFSNTMQAHIAKGLLESHGIAASIMHEQFHSMYNFALGEVPLLVDEEDFIHAKEILHETFGFEYKEDENQTFSA